MKFLLACSIFLAIGSLHSLAGKLDTKNVIFQLYTRSNHIRGGSRLLMEDVREMKSSDFNPSLCTMMMVHGYLSNIEKDNIAAVKDAVLANFDCNYIAVDWSTCAKNIWYATTVTCAKELGHHIAEFVSHLEKYPSFSVKNLHIMGHSLGAHAASMISTRYNGTNKIGRVTGLDPAKPSYEKAPLSERIDPSDADYVDIIHTDVDSYGLSEPCGTADFYPNGGTKQPGCDGGECSHKKAVVYMVDSLYGPNREKYVGVRCNDVKAALNKKCDGGPGYMGYDSYKSKPGIYYVNVQ